MADHKGLWGRIEPWLARAGRWLEPGPFHYAAFALIAAIHAWPRLARLPLMPQIEPDSGSYLEFAEFRPPGYPLFLDLHEAVFGGLQHLPVVQYGFLLLAIFALAAAAARVTRNIVVGLAAYYLAIKLAPDPNMASVMTETVYSAVACLAAAAFLAWTGKGRLRWLIVCAALVGYASVTRSIGNVLIVAFLAALAVALLQKRIRLWAAAGAVAPIIAVVLGASSLNLAHNGVFGIGSWGGMSWLGHGLMVAKPLPPSSPYHDLNWIMQKAAPAQEEVAQAPSLALKMLLLRLYYFHLRWEQISVDFDQRWPAWMSAELDSQQGDLAGDLAKAYIANNPKGYAELVALDYGSLWLVPRVITEPERAFLQRQLDGLGHLTYLTPFESDPRAELDWFKVVPQAHPVSHVWLLRLCNAAFLGLSFALAVLLLFSRRVRASPLLAPALFTALAVHLTYAGTAIVESGQPRFIYPTWPILVAAIPIMGALLLGWSRRA